MLFFSNLKLVFCFPNLFIRLEPGVGLFCIEARSIHDPLCGQGKEVGRNAYIGSSPHSPPHYRRFIILKELLDQLDALDFEVLFSGEKNGWAVYNNEDPVVIRVVARRRLQPQKSIGT